MMKEEIKEKKWKYLYKTAGMIWGGKTYYCSVCEKEIEGFENRPSVQEFRISGLCQDCQDKTSRCYSTGKKRNEGMA